MKALELCEGSLFQVLSSILGWRTSVYLRDSSIPPPLLVGVLCWGANRQAILRQELYKEKLTAVPSLGPAIVLAPCDALSFQGTLCQQECEASCEIQLILQPAHIPPSRAGPVRTRQH